MNEIKISECDFSTAVEDLLKLFGWKYHHSRPARTEHGWRTALSGHKGFLDYIAVRSSRLLIFELKSEKGTISREQKEWIDALRETGVIVEIWRPSDWDRIEGILKW